MTDVAKVEVGYGTEKEVGQQLTKVIFRILSSRQVGKLFNNTSQMLSLNNFKK